VAAVDSTAAAVVADSMAVAAVTVVVDTTESSESIEEGR
jgi:hypothetical protein